ncbi:MAG: hypothetical protein ACRDEB_07200 [Chitinophagaceae bacterium]
MKILLINPPDNYHELINSNIERQLCRKHELPDFVHLFVKTKNEFETNLNRLIPVCKKNSVIIIWVSWFKKSAKIPTDVTEDLIRDFALANGLVDVKVCAVSEVWSGLKLVVPLKLR